MRRAEIGPDRLTGNETIDNDHKALVQYVNELNQAMMKGQGGNGLGGFIEKLIGYTREHYTRQAMIWRQGRLPILDAHRQTHIEMVGQVTRLRVDFAKGRITLSTVTMDFLRNRLISHVFGTDKSAVQAIGRKMA